ncbi:MAG: cysteine desulfurase family protein [Myxococcota bacterium]
MRIYLDHNATTPVRPEVADAMHAVLREEYGNPSSVYAEGATTRAKIEAARAEVAALLGVEPAEVRFTGGATEANNTVLFGLVAPGDHVVTSQVEHPSVAAPLALLEERGTKVDWIAPDDTGCVVAADLIAALREETKLVSLIWANNETGSLQPVAEVAAACRDRGILLHVDATQAIGKAEVDLSKVPADLLSLSAHKLGGPKGSGALIIRRGLNVPSYLVGGGQERGLRGGTENVAGIVGLGRACALAREELSGRLEQYGRLRDRLWDGISKGVEGVRWNGDPERVLRNTLNVEFAGIAGEVLLQALDLEGVALSAGAACHSGSIEPSAVLTAMGRTPEQARASLRLSVGWGMDEAQIDRAIALLTEYVPRVRAVEAP